MPCDSVITSRVDLAVADGEFLDAALKRMGAEVLSPNLFVLRGLRYRVAKGKLEATGLNERVLAEVANEVKRAYAEETVVRGADRFGWMEAGRDARGRLVLERRF